jgi:hypothetical protein
MGTSILRKTLVCQYFIRLFYNRIQFTIWQAGDPAQIHPLYPLIEHPETLELAFLGKHYDVVTSISRSQSKLSLKEPEFSQQNTDGWEIVTHCSKLYA